MKKKVILCLQKDITNVVNWALKDLTSLSVQIYDHLHQLEKAIENTENFSLLVIDSFLDGQSTIPILRKIKEKSKIKILLIIPQDTAKQELVELIQKKLVDNVIIRPFNANQIVEAVAKLCGIVKPSEKPWYMYTKKE